MPLPENPDNSWSGYLQATRNKPLHPLFLHLEPHLPPSGRAVDLGCGVGHAVVWLAEKGWEVEAVDGNPEALQIVSERLTDETRPRVKLSESMLEEVSLAPGAFDLVVAAFSLFFIRSREDFDRVWALIGAAIKPGGLFLGTLMGPHDDWAGRCIVHDASEVESLLSGWQVLHLEEADQDGATSQGTPKHWHVFHVIARKPI
jgi:tellurite methyltransferase